jgi:hypothetical protein
LYRQLGLVSIHAVVYFGYENRGLPFIGVLALVVAIVVVIQLAGMWKRKRKQANASGVGSNMALQ